LIEEATMEMEALAAGRLQESDIRHCKIKKENRKYDMNY
jgi:hypothetical protein